MCWSDVESTFSDEKIEERREFFLLLVAVVVLLLVLAYEAFRAMGPATFLIK